MSDYEGGSVSHYNSAASNNKAAVFAGAKSLLLALLTSATLTCLGISGRAEAQANCAPPVSNPIVCENALPGNPQSQWDITGIGDPSIQGFATDISVNVGQTVSFKIKSAAAYRIDIYRMGYYGGNGARKFATLNPPLGTPQPECVTNPTTENYDCSGWSVSASGRRRHSR